MKWIIGIFLIVICLIFMVICMALADYFRIEE